MKYKIKGTDILYNGKVYAEGQTIELNDKDAKVILDYLEFIPEETIPKKVVSKNTPKPKAANDITPKTGAEETATTKEADE